MSGHGIGPLGCGDVGGEELVGIDPLLGRPRATAIT